jgi:hypothetical protein
MDAKPGLVERVSDRQLLLRAAAALEAVKELLISAAEYELAGRTRDIRNLVQEAIKPRQTKPKIRKILGTAKKPSKKLMPHMEMLRLAMHNTRNLTGKDTI